MTAAQALSFAVIGGAVAAFAWGRFRYDVVAVVALLIGVVTGDVAPKQAFSGFSSDVVVIIACALIISAAIARSGLVEHMVGPLLARLKRVRVQVPVFAGATALLSMATKNVGALAILMPVAIRTGRESGTPASALLMPMAFMSLLGGLVTLPGTSTNIIVSQVREDTLGKPFAMFDFAPVGLTLTVLGLLFVTFGYRLLPRGRKGKVGMDEVAAQAPYATEAKVPDTLPDSLATIADLKLDQDGVKLRAIVKEDDSRHRASPDAKLVPGQILLLEGSDEAFSRLFARVPLVAMQDENAVEKEEPNEELRSIEAVVQPDSLLIGTSARRENLQERYGIRLLAIGRGGERISERLRETSLQAGDMLILQAGEKALPGGMQALGLLPLAERIVKMGQRRRLYGPALILAAAILSIVFDILPVAAAFFGAAVLVVAIGALSMREAYGALEPEVLVLIGALTPLSEAVHHSGGTVLIAHGLAQLLHGVTPLLVLGALLVTAMACSPFLHNAPTVLVLGPIAVDLAQQFHLNPDPFLMAVATGAGCDFLTPIGHQCNTLVMGPGGYRFGDYWRLGLPLSLLVVAVGTPMIAFVWPMLPG